MNIKLEALRGGGVHTFEVGAESDPPDVVFWDNRVFRYQRTDGVWDQKKHVYRESSACRLSEDGRKFEPANIGDFAVETPEAAPAPDAEEETRKVSLNLTPPQGEMLKRVRERGGYPSNKAAVIAALEALDRGGVLSNDALLSMLARRLRGAETNARLVYNKA